MSSHLAWFRDVVIIDGNYINATFDNRRLAGQHGGGLVIGKVKIKLRKDKQENKDKKESEDEQKGKETSVKEANETEDKQRGEETGVEETNKLEEPMESSDESDKPSESIGLDCLFMPTV